MFENRRNHFKKQIKQGWNWNGIKQFAVPLVHPDLYSKWDAIMHNSLKARNHQQRNGSKTNQNKLYQSPFMPIIWNFPNINNYITHNNIDKMDQYQGKIR